ncbi:MAG: Gfo/Idh/MocA family oxidoreductase [Planctomycetes bacterium]|nr:Gfo/Idh/MocA family oxidoreductase [Planctomycetota bacterium]
MDRRTFVKASASVTVPFIVPSSVFGKDAPSNRLNMAAIGTGRMGHSDMKECLNQGLQAGARLVAVCDVDSERAKHAKNEVEKIYAKELGEGNFQKVQVYDDYRELLERKDIDGVTISTPEHWHGLIGIAAANAGKDMYVQKPLTYSIVEGQRLVEAVRRNNVILQTGSQQRSSVYFRKTCELVRNGRIGKLQTIEVVVPTDNGRGESTPMEVPKNLNYDMWLGPTAKMPYTEHRVHPQEGFGRPGWLQIERYCRGMITGWGAHMYDIAQWALGVDLDSGPVEVKATAEFPDRGLFDVHVGYEAQAEYANGVKMISHNGKAGVKFIGTDGWLWVQRGSFDAPDRNIFREEFAAGDIKLVESKNHMLNFLESMRSRKDPIAPVEAGHRSNSVCVIHHIAMKLGRKLRWDPKAERFLNDDEANSMLDYPHRRPWII